DGAGGGEGALDGQPGSARDGEGLRVRLQQPGSRPALAPDPGRDRLPGRVRCDAQRAAAGRARHGIGRRAEVRRAARARRGRGGRRRGLHGGERGPEPRALRRGDQRSARRPAGAPGRAGRHRPRAARERAPPMTTEARLARARRVLDIERRALAALGDGLDGRFGRAIELLLACRGRVIVTGIGKSGIVCRKIAATLTSTGTPAFFLHAGEGSHGDLGTLVRGDVLLAVSNSGESAEVLSLLPLVPEHAAFTDTLVEMTSKRLGVTGVVNGAGQLVGVITDGDLRRGLERAADLRQLTARDLMTTAPKTIGGGALAAEAVAIMERHAITSLFILAEGSRRPAGMIHLHDLLRAGVV